MKQLPYAQLVLLGTLLFSISAPALAAPSAQTKSTASEAEDAQEADDDKMTLEKLFDEKGWFGSPPSGTAVSFDGRYAAYLWRPYDERRHGRDLYLLDMASGESKRITSVSVMSEFQEDTRLVGEERVKKAKGKAKAKENDNSEAKDGSWSELKDKAKSAPPKKDQQEVDQRDVVSKDDADDKEALRYRGIRGLAWSPTAEELLFTSEGDIYRFYVEPEEAAAEIERVTKTREVEREVQYLPDGSGYTTLLGDALVRVHFGDHFVDQLDPELPDNMRMMAYELSPDGNKVAFLARAGSTSPGNRTVDIATYNDRFMRVRTVPRTVSDDPISNAKTGVFVFELPDREREDGQLSKVFEQSATGPRDILRVPDWAPDSSRVTFAVFDQESSQVRVLEAIVPESSEEPEEDSAEDSTESSSEEAEEEAADDESKEAPKKEKPDEAIKARTVHRFLHNGGPNTPRMIMPRYLGDSRRIVMLTEQTGFRQLHVLDPVYETLEPLTQGHFEVYPLEMPKDRSCIFVEATKEDSACLDLYRVDFDTKEMKRLTQERGQYTGGVFSPDGQHGLATFSAFGTARDLVHIDVAKELQQRVTESHPERTKKILTHQPDFFAYENREGQKIHGYLFEPEESKAKKDADAELKPLLIYVYGGPLGTRKQVTEGNYGGASLFAHYMTHEHGYVTAIIDPRGMSGYGALFEKANFEQVGKPQVDDLVDGVRYLIENHGVDPERVAIHGWSFGGFQTQMCLYTEPDVFKCGIAGAGPTEWENYNSWYSTGTIGESRTGKTDLAKYSLLPLAKNLKGKLLLVHGMEDANVLYQDTVRVYAELLEAGKETLVELFLDPSGGHGLGGKVKALNRYRKYEEFLLRSL